MLDAHGGDRHARRARWLPAHARRSHRPRAKGAAMTVLTNLDAGERDDATEELWLLFDLLNVACGGHAGDDASMARVARCAAEPRPRIGAHPSYPDREHFGRRSLAIEPVEL